uniref:ATPase H+ transporting accessory protein 1 n=1 Tax=Athene cunicularia TaxID=194338 RepID=A0A663N6T7_ATHCN
ELYSSLATKISDGAGKCFGSWDSLWEFFLNVFNIFVLISLSRFFFFFLNWDPDTALHEGHLVSAQELTVFLQPVFTQNSRNLILFLQDTLSIDDFTYLSESYGNKNPFQNVQNSPSSLVLPAVDCEATRYILSFLQESGDWNLTNITNLSELVTNKTDPHECMIFKNVTFENISRKTEVVWGLRRQLMATEEEDSLSYPPLNVTIGNDTCILFYARNFSLKANNSVFIDLTNTTFITQNLALVNLYLPPVLYQITINFFLLSFCLFPSDIFTFFLLCCLSRFLMTNKFYGGSARNWSTLDSVEIVQDGEKFAKFNVSVMSAPVEYSFHCQLVGTKMLLGVTFLFSTWDLTLPQKSYSFNVENNRFSYASDCTGFFTPGIWMGLVISVVLLWILAYGIHMITQLTTNSRFDDPKGPALSVPQTE